MEQVDDYKSKGNAEQVVTHELSTSDFDSTSQARMTHKYSRRPQYYRKTKANSNI